MDLERQPDAPPSAAWLAELVAEAGGHIEAAAVLHVSLSTVYRWASGESVCPWASAELLRRHVRGERCADTAPDPVSQDYARQLMDRAGGQCAAARLLNTNERTARRWASGERPMSWASAELLRRMSSP